MTTTASAKQISFLSDMLSRTAATDEQITEAAAEVVADFVSRTGIQTAPATLVALTVSAARDPQAADKAFVSLAIATLKDIRDFGGPRNR